MKKILRYKIDNPDTSTDEVELKADEEMTDYTSIVIKDENPYAPPLPIDPVTPENLEATYAMEEDINQDEIHEYLRKESSDSDVTCRDFARGSCVRPGCKYLHVISNFCHDYQNSSCTRPLCNYAHGTVFEEQHYKRTGVLPPHALDHIIKRNKATRTVPPYNINVPSTASTIHPDASVPQVECSSLLSTSRIELLPPPRRPPPPCFSNETACCGDCIEMEIRFLHVVMKLESMRASIEEKKRKLELLNDKERRIDNFLAVISINQLMVPCDYWQINEEFNQSAGSPFAEHRKR